jgi:hypothetical protein
MSFLKKWLVFLLFIECYSKMHHVYAVNTTYLRSSSDIYRSCGLQFYIGFELPWECSVSTYRTAVRVLCFDLSNCRESALFRPILLTGWTRLQELAHSSLKCAHLQNNFCEFTCRIGLDVHLFQVDLRSPCWKTDRNIYQYNTASMYRVCLSIWC